MSNKKNTLISDIENLTKEKILAADDSEVQRLKDLLFDARTKLNPYNVKVNNCDKGSLLFSFVNMQRDYMTKFIATAFLGFMRRAVNEWGVPDAPVSVPVVDVIDYIKDPTLIEPIKPSTTSNATLSDDILEAYEENKKMMQKRVIVTEFLEYMFGFDPDRHARPGYKPNFKDTERRPILTPSAELSLLINKKRTEKSKKSTSLEKQEAKILYEKYLEEKKKIEAGEIIEKPFTRKIIKTIKSKEGKIIKVERIVKCTETEYKLAMMKDDPEDKDNLILPNEQKVIPVGTPEWNNYFDKQNKAKDQTLNNIVKDLIPPADMFYKFNVYVDKHYEQLQDAVRDLYHEKPDFDASIYPYKLIKEYKNEKGVIVTIDEQIKRFRQDNARDIFFGINEVKCGNWSIIAPYHKNRERVEYYGQNMAIFEEMFKMKASEKALAKDMMDKSVSRRRKTIQKKHGKVDPEFNKNYGTQASKEISNLGVEQIEDENEEINDAIEVGVFRISQGGKKIEVDKFYTESEAPTFMAK